VLPDGSYLSEIKSFKGPGKTRHAYPLRSADFCGSGHRRVGAGEPARAVCVDLPVGRR
jgi:hypothetical protein